MALAKIVADFRTSLATKLAAGASTCSLQSITDDDGVTIPNGTYFFTLDGDNSQKEHIVATLTGVNLTDISSISRQGVQTANAVREHRIGATVTITNFAHIKYLNDLLDGTTDLDASNPLAYDADPDLTGNNKKLATVKLVEDTAMAGGADASTSVKGISKLSVAPASATEPIAVGVNDPKLPPVDTSSLSADKLAALAGTSGTPSAANPYVTNDDTATAATASKIPRAGGTGKIDSDWVDFSSIVGQLFSIGTDGDVDINSGAFTSGPITSNVLTRDAYFNNLTLSGGNLNPNGFRIFVKGTTTINVGYKIFSNGGNGGAGGNGAVTVGGSAGAAGAAANGAGSIKASVAGVIGKAGGNGATNSGAAGTAGTNGIAQTVSLLTANGSGNTDQASGAGGHGSTGAAAGGASAVGGSGAVTTAATKKMKSILEIIRFLEPADYVLSSYALYGTTASGASGGSGGGGGGSGSTSWQGGGGGGSGGSGAPGGIVFLATNSLINNGTIEAIGGNGGNGGNGANGQSDGSTNCGGGGGGGTGGVGGNGGVIYLLYTSKTGSGSTSVVGGTKGTKGTKGLRGGAFGSATDGADGSDGYADGTAGSVIEIVI